MSIKLRRNEADQFKEKRFKKKNRKLDQIKRKLERINEYTFREASLIL